MTEFLCWKVRCPSPEPRQQRRVIDRSMIGPPTDFKHTAHIGAGDHFNIMIPSSMATSSAEAFGGSSPHGDTSLTSAHPFGTTPPSPSNELSPSAFPLDSPSSHTQSSPLHMSNLRPITNPLISPTQLRAS